VILSSEIFLLGRPFSESDLYVAEASNSFSRADENKLARIEPARSEQRGQIVLEIVMCQEPSLIGNGYFHVKEKRLCARG